MMTARSVYRWGAVVLGLLALVPGYYAVTLRWGPKTDFDMIGVLWVMQNLPRLTAYVMTAAFLAGAAWFAARSLR